MQDKPSDRNQARRDLNGNAHTENQNDILLRSLDRKMKAFVLTLVVTWSFPAWAQTTLTWEELAGVEFTSEYNAEFGIDIQTAHFGDHLKALEGMEVFVSGYMIPVDPLGTRYVLSRFTNANCFFCGNAGPETIVELHLLPKFIRRYATDTYATFKGKLQLNAQNLHSFNYVLEEAQKM